MLKTLLALTLTIGYTATVQAGLTISQQNKLLALHNQWRSLVGVPALKWSKPLAAQAQSWVNSLKAQGCALKHNYDSPYGENLYWAGAIYSYYDGTTKVQPIAPATVVNVWGNEKQHYSYNSNTCNSNKGCGHYTQIVWRNTTELGCAKVICADKSQIWSCYYQPAGNYIGEKPY